MSNSILSTPTPIRRPTMAENNRQQEIEAVRMIRELFARVANGEPIHKFGVMVSIGGGKIGPPRMVIESS